MSKWESIKSAPKDKRIMLYYPDEFMGQSVLIGKWADDNYKKTPTPHFTNDFEHLAGLKYTRYNQPTHWMPIPDGPETED